MEQAQRPLTVTLSTVLMVVFLILGLVWWIPQIPTALQVVFFGFALFTGGLLFLYWKGSNWMRRAVILTTFVAVLPSTILSMAMYVFGYGTDPALVDVQWFYSALMAAEGIFGLYLLYALNTAQVRSFFMARPAPSLATECIQGYRSASSMTKGMFFVGLALGAIAFALVVGSIAYLYFT